MPTKINIDDSSQINSTQDELNEITAPNSVTVNYVINYVKAGTPVVSPNKSYFELCLDTTNKICYKIWAWSSDWTQFLETVNGFSFAFIADGEDTSGNSGTYTHDGTIYRFDENGEMSTETIENGTKVIVIGGGDETYRNTHQYEMELLYINDKIYVGRGVGKNTSFNGTMFSKGKFILHLGCCTFTGYNSGTQLDDYPYYPRIADGRGFEENIADGEFCLAECKFYSPTRGTICKVSENHFSGYECGKGIISISDTDDRTAWIKNNTVSGRRALKNAEIGSVGETNFMYNLINGNEAGASMVVTNSEANYLIFKGNAAGKLSTNPNSVIFFGNSSGYNSTDIVDSAGYGDYSFYNADTILRSIGIGKNTFNGTSDSTNDLAIGNDSLRDSDTTEDNIIIGNTKELTNSYRNIIIGNDIYSAGSKTLVDKFIVDNQTRTYPYIEGDMQTTTPNIKFNCDVYLNQTYALGSQTVTIPPDPCTLTDIRTFLCDLTSKLVLMGLIQTT